MIELYSHTVYFTNGANLHFDSESPTDFPEDGLCKMRFATTGNQTIINMKNINAVEITHLTLTEEEYENRKKLLKTK